MTVNFCMHIINCCNLGLITDGEKAYVCFVPFVMFCSTLHYVHRQHCMMYYDSCK